MTTNSGIDAVTAEVMERLRRVSIEITPDEARVVLEDSAWIAPARAAVQRIVHQEVVMFDPPGEKEQR